jgi:hypothetical protein
MIDSHKGGYALRLPPIRRVAFLLFAQPAYFVAEDHEIGFVADQQVFIDVSPLQVTADEPKDECDPDYDESQHVLPQRLNLSIPVWPNPQGKPINDPGNPSGRCVPFSSGNREQD